MATPEQAPARYRIRIRGHLGPAWSGWFDGLTVDQADDGTTELAGPLADQAALFGLLARLRDLGATLLLVEHLPDYGGPPPSAACRDGSSSSTRSETGFTSSRYHPAARPNPSPRSHPASQR
jgi:hypothetical protein